MTVDLRNPPVDRWPPNFSEREFRRPLVRDDFPAAAAPKMRRVAWLLQWLRELGGMPGTVTNAHRAPGTQAKIPEAVAGSQHDHTEAADVVFSAVPIRSLGDAILKAIRARQAPAFDQLILYADKGHVHASIPKNPAAPRGQVLWSPGVGGDGRRIFRPLVQASDLPILSDPQKKNSAALVQQFYSLWRSGISREAGKQ